ncbi:hypothetical protein BDC45DRAFT_520912 [Circinella umbellata]|nr:hypothetical protein BDC45DRAFT_520912 [Circinella umbellata]
MSGFCKPCFWALLDPEQFRFMYLPNSVAQISVGDDNAQHTISALLQDQSLFSFIHPEEVENAKIDLERFLSARTLTGSITRCRLLTFECISNQYQDQRYSIPPIISSLPLTTRSSKYDDNGKNNYEGSVNHSSTMTRPLSSTSFLTLTDSQYAIVDVVLYTATESTILGFFHTATECPNIEKYKGGFDCCGDCEPNCYEISTMLDTLQKKQRPFTRDHIYFTSSLPASEKNLRLFQIHNSTTGKLIVSWPNSSFINGNTISSSNINSSGSYHHKIEEGLYIPNDYVYNLNRSQQPQQQQHQSKFDEILDTIRNVMEKEILLLNTMSTNQYKLKYQKIACTHPYRSSATVYLSDGVYRFEHIIIPYGFLTFGAFQVTMMAPLTISPPEHYESCVTATKNSPYRHYIHYNAPASHEENRRGSDNATATDYSFIGSSLLLPLDNPPSNPTSNNNNDCNKSNSTNTHSSSSSKKSSWMLTNIQQSMSHYPNSMTLSSLATTMHHTSISNQQNRNSQVHMPINKILCSQAFEPSVESKQVEDRRNEKIYYSYNNDIPSQRSMTIGRVCAKCHTNRSPEWRKGPSGDKTLCNACGLRFARKSKKSRS